MSYNRVTGKASCDRCGQLVTVGWNTDEHGGFTCGDCLEGRTPLKQRIAELEKRLAAAPSVSEESRLCPTCDATINAEGQCSRKPEFCKPQAQRASETVACKFCENADANRAGLAMFCTCGRRLDHMKPRTKEASPDVLNTIVDEAIAGLSPGISACDSLRKIKRLAYDEMQRPNEACTLNPDVPSRLRARRVIAQARAAGDALDFGFGLEAKIMAALDEERDEGLQFGLAYDPPGSTP